MYNVELIANWFLARNKYDNDLGISDEPMSNSKLQKLLYYAQVHNIKLTNTLLFNDDFEAWEHGPVIPKLYDKYEKFGRNGIIFNDNINMDLFTQQTIDILEDVYNNYSQYSAWKLREIVRQEIPWIRTKKNDIISKLYLFID